APRAGDGRARPGARGALVRRGRVRGDGAGRLLRPRGRRGAPERVEHDSGLHGDERLCEALRGLRCAVSGVGGPARAARAPTARAQVAPALLTAARGYLVDVHGPIRTEVGDPDQVVALGVAPGRERRLVADRP